MHRLREEDIEEDKQVHLACLEYKKARVVFANVLKRSANNKQRRRDILMGYVEQLTDAKSAGTLPATTNVNEDKSHKSITA